MKRSHLKTMIMTFSMGVLLLFLGTIAPTYAQQEQHGQDSNPPKQEQQKHAKVRHKKQIHAKGQQKQQPPAQGQPEQQSPGGGQQEQPPQSQGQHEHRANRPSQHGPGMQNEEVQGAWQQHRAHSWQSEHHNWQQRGGYNGYRIPEEHFRTHFGPEHVFRIYSCPMIVIDGYPRFHYLGYWFSVVDPWPEYWADNWYYDDDVYIVYSDDGYYLCNHRHPQDLIAITVYLN